MLFNYYGIFKTPIGSPANPVLIPQIPALPPGLNGATLDPGTLNFAMANYRTNFITKGSVGFDSANNPDWIGAVQVARGGYQAQCKAPVSCDPANAPNVISFKKYVAPSGGLTEQQAISALQNEICGGNPVIVGVNKNGSGQHFLLATGIVTDGVGNQTLQVNNPGLTRGRSQHYSDIKNEYPSVKGYVLYQPSADPSMMVVTASTNVHFVITDPMGRRAGYDPIAQIDYSEIPDATYTDQSIDSPNEVGFLPQTLVDERYFLSSKDVLDGSYRIQVFSISGGSYYFDYRSYDTNGFINSSIIKSGSLDKGKSITASFIHTSAVAPISNASLEVDHYFFRTIRKSSFEKSIFFIGTIKPFSREKIALHSSFQLAIGGASGYNLSIPAENFKIEKIGSGKNRRTLYRYLHLGNEVVVSDSGKVIVRIKNADLTQVDESQLGYVRVTIDSISADTNMPIERGRSHCSLKSKSPISHDINHHKNKNEKGNHR